MPQTIRVELSERGYDVQVAAGALERIGETVAGLSDVSQAVVFADGNVAGHYGPAVRTSLEAAELTANVIKVPPGESNKTLAGASAMFDALFDLPTPIDRDTVIVALGGGVTGDMAGFVAATALRGLRWVNCPTTLLADVDASVGGKTAVDHPAGKNLIGAFHQPRAVLIDVDTLATLPVDEVRAGLAECVKHAVIRDAALLEYLEDHIEAMLACDPAVMTELIARNVAIKAEVVAADETESTGERAHLNFGHSIAHAIETLAGYEAISHGQAVALGMVGACRLAVSRGLIEDELADRIEELLAALGLPIRRPGLDAAEVWRVMQYDKKNRGGQVRMILPVTLGAVAEFDDITPEQIDRAVAAVSAAR